MKVSKNQVVWARCHFAGEASGKGWIVASASDSGAARSSVSLRVANSLSLSSVGPVSESALAICGPLPRKSGQVQSEVHEMFYRNDQPRVAPGCHRMSPPSLAATYR